MERDGAAVNLPRAVLSEHARRRQVREDTKRPMTTLKELQALEAEIEERVHTTTVGWLLNSHSFTVWKSGKEKASLRGPTHPCFIAWACTDCA